MIRTFALAALALAAVAARADEEVLFLQTQENPEVATNCLPGENVVLGAYVYAPRTRASDGMVVKQLGHPLGTAVGCGLLTSIAVGAKAPFRLTLDMGGRQVVSRGECTVAERFAPLAPKPWPLLLVGCHLAVTPDESQGLLHGIASSASVFLPYPIPGFDTGSFWTLHLYTAD